MRYPTAQFNTYTEPLMVKLRLVGAHTSSDSSTANGSHTRLLLTPASKWPATYCRNHQNHLQSPSNPMDQTKQNPPHIICCQSRDPPSSSHPGPRTLFPIPPNSTKWPTTLCHTTGDIPHKAYQNIAVIHPTQQINRQEITAATETTNKTATPSHHDFLPTKHRPLMGR